MKAIACPPSPLPKIEGTEPCDRIRTRGIEIVNDDGKTVACIEAVEGGAGLWITSREGVVLTAFSIEGQAGLGFYDKTQTVFRGLGFSDSSLSIQSAPESATTAVEIYQISTDDIQKLLSQSSLPDKAKEVFDLTGVSKEY